MEKALPHCVCTSAFSRKVGRFSGPALRPGCIADMEVGPGCRAPMQVGGTAGGRALLGGRGGGVAPRREEQTWWSPADLGWATAPGSLLGPG